MATQRERVVARVHVPQADGLVSTGRGEAHAIGAETQADNTVSMTGKFVQRDGPLAVRRIGGHVPDTNRLIRARRSEPPTVGADDRAFDIAAMPLQGEEHGPRRD